MASTRRLSRWGILGGAFLASGPLAGRANAQEPQLLNLPPGVPHFVGPGTQGTPVYVGPTFVECSSSAWACTDESGLIPISIAEVADDVHLTQGGVLASFTVTYLTASFHALGVEGSVPVGLGNDVTVILRVYPNDPTDSTLPTGPPLATYAFPNRPRHDLMFFTETFDVPAGMGIPVTQDLWVGVELTNLLPDLVGSLALPAFACDVELPVGTPSTGTSHTAYWFGPGTCVGPSGLAQDAVQDQPGFPTNHYLTIRVFTDEPNQPPTCVTDLSEVDFLEVAPGEFVVTEGETLTVPFTGTDPDGDMLTVSVDGLPPGATLTPSSGPSPLIATLVWTPTAADDAGAPYVIQVTFTDSDGAFTSCSVTVADVNLIPVCGASVDPDGTETYECTSADGAVVHLGGFALDDDDPFASLSFQWAVSDLEVVLDDPTILDPTGTFPIGVTMATLVVTDGRGGICTSGVFVVVQDTTPPEVLVTTDVAALSPPNHGMRTVTVLVTATDACAEPGEVIPIVVTVRSDEPDDASGGADGNTTGDVDGFDGFSSPVDISAELIPGLLPGTFLATIQLRAERASSGDGRQYAIDVSALDSADNLATASCVVVVPHDRRGLSGP